MVAAPIPLITALRAHRGSVAFSASQWRTIPVCDSVNDVNTPTT